MQDQVFATQAIKQIDEHQKKWLQNYNCSIINQQSAYPPPINARKEMWVSGNLITGLTLCWWEVQ